MSASFTEGRMVLEIQLRIFLWYTLGYSVQHYLQKQTQFKYPSVGDWLNDLVVHMHSGALSIMEISPFTTVSLCLCPEYILQQKANNNNKKPHSVHSVLSFIWQGGGVVTIWGKKGNSWPSLNMSSFVGLTFELCEYYFIANSKIQI